MCRFGAELGELGNAQVFFVEGAVDLLHHLLEAIGAHDVAVAHHTRNGFRDEFPRVVLGVGSAVFVGLNEAGERVVAVVLVAVLHEQIAGRLTNTDADNVLAVFLELDDEAREVGVAGQQDDRADFRTREDELDRVDGEADVGCVLLGRPVGRGEDEVDRRFAERDDVLRVAAPIRVGALNGDLSVDDVGRQQVAQLRLKIRADPHRDVVEIDEERGVGRVMRNEGTRHHGLRGMRLRSAVQRRHRPAGWNDVRMT